MEPITILNSIATTLGIIDKVADQIERFHKKEPEPLKAEPPGLLAEKRDNVINFVKDNMVRETITADDFTKLDPQSQRLIKSIELSMQQQFELWTTVYPQRDSSVDPIINAKINSQLNVIAQRMCSDLGRILAYLESMDKHLTDHYQHVRFICEEYEDHVR